MAETKQKKAKAKKSQAKRGSSGAGSVVDSVKTGAHDAVNGVSPILHKAKLPLLAGGAAAAGVAGAVLASRSGHKRKVLGVTVPKRSKLSLPKGNGFKPDARKMSKAVADAARRADNIGQGVSKIASSVQKVGESAEDVVKKS